jgi:hypothetical protein
MQIAGGCALLLHHLAHGEDRATRTAMLTTSGTSVRRTVLTPAISGGTKDLLRAPPDSGRRIAHDVDRSARGAGQAPPAEQGSR